MKVTKFEELTVWQEVRIFVKSIYEKTREINFIKDYGLKDQIQRASVSIIANIAECFERSNNKEFIHFLCFSKASAGEVRSLLYVALDLGYINELEFQKMYQHAISISGQLSNFIKYLKTNIK